MPQYEPDEFDDVPADSPHRGAYRADPADKTGGYRGTFGMIAVGICVLVLGGVMFLLAPRTSAPGASITEETASPTQSSAPAESSSGASGSASGEAETPADPNTTIGVYNNGLPEGTATDAASTLQEAGWSISDLSAWDGSSEGESVVYYAPGAQEQAEAVAEELGISRTEETSGYYYQLVVVLAGEVPSP